MTPHFYRVVTPNWLTPAQGYAMILSSLERTSHPLVGKRTSVKPNTLYRVSRFISCVSGSGVTARIYTGTGAEDRAGFSFVQSEPGSVGSTTKPLSDLIGGHLERE